MIADHFFLGCIVPTAIAVLLGFFIWLG